MVGKRENVSPAERTETQAGDDPPSITSPPPNDRATSLPSTATSLSRSRTVQSLPSLLIRCHSHGRAGSSHRRPSPFATAAAQPSSRRSSSSPPHLPPNHHHECQPFRSVLTLVLWRPPSAVLMELPPQTASSSRPRTRSSQATRRVTGLSCTPPLSSSLARSAGADTLCSTYAQGRNDLKVQATGDGGLEELADEFKDGRYVEFQLRSRPSRPDDFPFIRSALSRIQYAFVRVMDSNSELPKFIQIVRCHAPSLSTWHSLVARTRPHRPSELTEVPPSSIELVWR